MPLSGVEELFFQQTGEVRFLKGAEPDQPVVDGPDPVPTVPAPYIEPPAEPEPPAGGGGDTTVPDPQPGNGGTFVANPTGGELVGTNGNDVLLGSFTDDFVYGFDGDDFANLARGSDSFYGGAGQDTVNDNRSAAHIYTYLPIQRQRTPTRISNASGLLSQRRRTWLITASTTTDTPTLHIVFPDV